MSNRGNDPMEEVRLQDPRVFFAAERTLLAWVRTGLTIMAFGFVVARFGLFLRLMAHSMGEQRDFNGYLSVSHIVGVLMVCLGVVFVVVPVLQHRNFVRHLTDAELPRAYYTSVAPLLSLCIGALGIMLALYLVISAPK